MSQDFVFLNESNIDDFYLIFHDAFSLDANNRSMDFESFRQNLVNLNIKTELSFLIKDEGIPMGLFLGTSRGNKGYISSIGVAKNQRKQGYGQILLEKGLSIMENNGCRKIRLEVLDDNENAISLYLKSGFRVSNTIFNYSCENSVIFNDMADENYTLGESDSFSFQILYNSFHKAGLPWQRSLSGIYSRIESKKAKLFILRHFNSTEGYVVTSMDNGTINLEDTGLKNYSAENLGILLSLIIRNTANDSPQNGLNIISNNNYKNDPLCPAVEKLGFNVYIRQLEMEKRLT